MGRRKNRLRRADSFRRLRTREHSIICIPRTHTTRKPSTPTFIYCPLITRAIIQIEVQLWPSTIGTVRVRRGQVTAHFPQDKNPTERSAFCLLLALSAGRIDKGSDSISIEFTLFSSIRSVCL